VSGCGEGEEKDAGGVSPRRARRGAYLRLVAATAAAAPPLASVALLGLGWLSPGYDPLRRTISRLAEPGAPYALEVRLILAALGLALLSTAWVLDRRHATWARPAAAALAVAGLALLGVALVRRDTARPAVLVVHRLLALTLFAALALAPLLAAVGLRALPALRAWLAASAVTAALSAVLVTAAVALLLAGSLPAGAWERAFVGLNLLWVTLLAGRLART
jgi:hypothetical protein